MMKSIPLTHLEYMMPEEIAKRNKKTLDNLLKEFIREQYNKL